MVCGTGCSGQRLEQLGSDSNCFQLEVTLKPPAMGTHFSGLSLKKWSPGRAALKEFFCLTVVLGQTCSERRSSAAVSGV